MGHARFGLIVVAVAGTIILTTTAVISFTDRQNAIIQNAFTSPTAHEKAEQHLTHMRRDYHCNQLVSDFAAADRIATRYNKLAVLYNETARQAESPRRAVQLTRGMVPATFQEEQVNPWLECAERGIRQSPVLVE